MFIQHHTGHEDGKRGKIHVLEKHVCEHINKLICQKGLYSAPTIGQRWNQKTRGVDRGKGEFKVCYTQL